MTAVTAAGSAAAAVGLAAAGLAAVMAVDTAPYSRSCRQRAVAALEEGLRLGVDDHPAHKGGCALREGEG